MFYKDISKNLVEMIKKSKFFDKVEIKVISAMLELEKEGKIKNTASIIAKRCGMSVTNAYKYLYNLAEIGIVEYEEDKQKLFWLSRVNPFDRIISMITKEYTERKAALKAAGDMYSRIISPIRVLEKPYIKNITSFDDFEKKCAYISDIAEGKLCIISDWVPEEFIILDSWKRVKERGVEMKWLANDLSEEKTELLQKLGFEVRFFDEIIYFFIMVADENNGVVVKNINKEKINGFWFINQENDFQKNFDEWWDSAGEIK